MKRFRGKVWVTFNSGKTISIEHVVIAENIKDATKICEIEFNGDYLENRNVKDFQIHPCIEDDTEKPSYKFVRENLLIANSIATVSSLNRERAESAIREAFFNYQPSYKDDFLLDVFSCCDEGVLEERFDVGDIIERLLDHLDRPFSCHYRPDKSLENQYKAMQERVKEITGYTMDEKRFNENMNSVIHDMSISYDNGEFDNENYLDGYVNAIWLVRTIAEENNILMPKDILAFDKLIDKEEREYYSQLQDNGITDDLHEDYYDGYIKGAGDTCKLLNMSIPKTCEMYMENDKEDINLD